MNYMTRKVHGWFRRWTRSGAVAASLAPASGTAPPTPGGEGGGAATPARAPAPGMADDEDTGTLITPGPAGADATASPILELATLERGLGQGA